MKENLRNRKAPEDDDGAVDRSVDPRWDFAIGNLAEVVLGPFQVHLCAKGLTNRKSAGGFVWEYV